MEGMLFPHFFPPLAPVARALYSSDLSSDSKLALKAGFADRYLLVGSLFFMVYLVYHQ